MKSLLNEIRDFIHAKDVAKPTLKAYISNEYRMGHTTLLCRHNRSSKAAKLQNLQP
ncbi:MAG: hypothetical protein ACK4TI_01430 [Nitrososphaerales archaeon]